MFAETLLTRKRKRFDWGIVVAEETCGSLSCRMAANNNNSNNNNNTDAEEVEDEKLTNNVKKLQVPKEILELKILHFSFWIIGMVRA